MDLISEFCEQVIRNYRQFYKELAISVATHSKCVRELGELIARYEPIVLKMEKDVKISIVTIVGISSELDQFIKSNFSAEFLKRYSTPPVENTPTLTNAYYSFEATLIFALISAGLDSLKNHPKQTVTKHKHQLNTLKEALSCLKDYGLHRLIDSRSEQFQRYNLIIEPKKKTGSAECLLTLSETDITNRFLIPYRKKTDLLIGGKFYPFRSIERMTVTVCKLNDEELLPYRQKRRITSNERFARSFPDCTSNLLKDGAMSTVENKALELPKEVLSTNHEFLESLIDGFRILQTQDTRPDFLENYLKDGRIREKGFQNFFNIWFNAMKHSVNEEVPKGNGRIDLKVSGPSIGTNILEFKGWWNQDKIELVKQLLRYLTEFEEFGYIIMINPLKKKDIVEEYKVLISQDSFEYVKDSWSEIKHRDSGFSYFVSQHSACRKTKTIYHFIYQIHLD